MKTLEEKLREDARLLTLQWLGEQNDYAAHEHAIRDMLETVGHTLSADAMRTELAWLQEQNAIDIAGERIRVARLTQRGDDAARGAARIPGIARPRPGR
jgi:hypothetical protein